MFLRLCLAGVLFLAPIRSAASDVSASLTLDRGYRHLYDLDFAGAEQEFNAWQQQHPANPMGPASQAAGLLFAEFHRLGVLETQFYESDEAFDARKKLAPDPSVRKRFDEILTQSDGLAQSRLTRDPQDRDALLALTMSAGLRADYAALVENVILLLSGIRRRLPVGPKNF